MPLLFPLTAESNLLTASDQESAVFKEKWRGQDIGRIMWITGDSDFLRGQ